MSGLFLNFFQVDIDAKTVAFFAKNYDEYLNKDDFREFRSANSNYIIYRNYNDILIWNNDNETPEIAELNQVEINLSEHPYVFSKILEHGIIDYLKDKFVDYKIFRNRYANTWQIISQNDLLENKIGGLTLNRVVHFSSYQTIKENKLLIGFSLSTSLKNTFTWDRKEFEKEGIDTKGLKGNDEIIYANRQSLKRFLETKGAEDEYNVIAIRENANQKAFEVIDSFYNWLDKHNTEIRLPFHLSIKKITKRYLPFENELIKSEIIYKPQRYFYSNRKNTEGLRFYDQMVKNYQPYSLELYQNRIVTIGIICPQEYQGEGEVFGKKIESKLKEVFHFQLLNFVFKTVKGKELEDYKEILYDEELQRCELIYIIVSQTHERLSPKNSPYHVCKAKLIGNGIPTQDIQIETIRQNLNAHTMTNIALNSYAKLGGTAWTIEKEEKLRDELIIGVGSTISSNGQQVLGIAQVFQNDGRYMTGDCSPLSTLDNYTKNLEEHLFQTLQPIVATMSKSGTFRLIFHLFKSASAKYEIRAINNLREKLSNFSFEFALVHLGYGHNHRLYYNDGKNDVKQGSYIQLNNHSALLHFVGKSDLPLKIDLDKRSTFKSLFYLSKQVYWFSHLSHRSYIPSKRTVTIMYPSLMAKMTEELKMVEGWDYDRLKAVKEKLWFI